MDIGVEDNKKKDLTKSIITILNPNQTQEYKYSCQPHTKKLYKTNYKKAHNI